MLHHTVPSTVPVAGALETTVSAAHALTPHIWPLPHQPELLTAHHLSLHPVAGDSCMLHHLMLRLLLSTQGPVISHSNAPAHQASVDCYALLSQGAAQHELLTTWTAASPHTAGQQYLAWFPQHNLTIIAFNSPPSHPPDPPPHPPR